MLTATPGPPMGLKSMVGPSFSEMIILGMGLLLIPLLRDYPASVLMIVTPAYLLVMSNLSMYLSIIMKAVSLCPQGSAVSARYAGLKLPGSTFLCGCFAILFCLVLGLFTHLWMFFLWTVLLGIYFSRKLFGHIPIRQSPSSWLNAFITMLILLGPAVEDNVSGKDVYLAFAVRMDLFVAVTIYAWAAIVALEYLRARRGNGVSYALPADSEVTAC